MLIFGCSADHEQDWQSYPVDPYSVVCDDHTFFYKGNGQNRVCRDTSWTKPAIHSRFHVRDGPVTSDSTGETTFFFSVVSCVWPF